MFWNKPKAASAETGGANEPSLGKRKRRIIPASVTGALVSAAILSGCGDSGGSSPEKLPEKSAALTKVKKERDQAKGIARELRPVAINIARRAIKISADQAPNNFSTKNPNISRLYSDYPGGPTTPEVTIVGYTRQDGIAEGFYMDVGKTNGKPDPRKVDLINLSVSRTNKPYGGNLENYIDILAAFKDYEGANYQWRGDSEISFNYSEGKDEPRIKLVKTNCLPDYDNHPPGQDPEVAAAQCVAEGADRMFTNMVQDMQG